MKRLTSRLSRPSDDELQIPSLERTAVDDSVAGAGHQVDEVARGHSAMAMNVAEESLVAAGIRAEVDRDEAPGRLQDTAHFAQRILVVI